MISKDVVVATVSMYMTRLCMNLLVFVVVVVVMLVIRWLAGCK